MKPLQAASMSTAAQPGTPSCSWTRQATLGKGPSGVDVATRIMSSSAGCTPEAASALRAALAASENVVVPGSAMRRRRMPVRSTIHWSEVSTIRSRSALERIRSGTSTPRPMIAAGRPCERYVRSGTASERTRGSAFTAIASHLRAFSLLGQQELPEVTDVLHLVEVLLGQLDVVLVLDRGDQLDQVERIGGQVPGEADVHLYLLGLDTEELGEKLQQLREVEFIRHRVSP